MKKNLSEIASQEAPFESLALLRGRQRTLDLQIHVRTVFDAIVKEIDENDGVYPHRGGALSMAEIARRAGVHPTTFHSPKQRRFGAEVKKWLMDLKGKKPLGAVSARKDLNNRVSQWREMYENLQKAQRRIELELQELEINSKKEILNRDREIADLRKLLEMYRAGKVISIATDK